MTAAAAGAARAVPRRELKFVLPDADVRAVASILRVNARPQRHGREPVSSVHSIYFDDAGLTSCNQSLAGLSRRSKVRVRWYDEPLPTRQAQFEVKQRLDGLGVKTRTPLPLPSRLDSCSYAELVRGWCARLEERQAAYLRSSDRPAVLVSYRRQHFVDPLSGTRLTLDYDVVAFDQLTRSRPARNCPVSLEGLVVVEVKASRVDVDRVRELLYPLTPRQTRCSKYVRSCAALCWVEPSALG